MKHHPVHALYGTRRYHCRADELAREREWIDSLAARNTRRAAKQHAANQQADSYSKRLSSVLLVVFFALLGFFLVSVAHGQEAPRDIATMTPRDYALHMSVYGASYHVNRRQANGERYNEFNPGLGLRISYRDTWSLEATRINNSHDRWSWCFGGEGLPLAWFNGALRAGLFVAACNNYPKRRASSANEQTATAAQAPAADEPRKHTRAPKHSEHTRTASVSNTSESGAAMSDTGGKKWVAGAGLALRVQHNAHSVTLRAIPEIKGYNSAVLAIGYGYRFKELP